MQLRAAIYTQADYIFNLSRSTRSCLILIICCCLSLQQLAAQTREIDSLKKILPDLDGTARIDCLNELGAEYADRYWTKSQYRQTDTGLLYTIQARNEAAQLHYLPGIGKADLNMSIIEEEHNNLVVAANYLRKAIPVLQKENMQASEAQSDRSYQG
jgi:hypothetical protein